MHTAVSWEASQLFCLPPLQWQASRCVTPHVITLLLFSWMFLTWLMPLQPACIWIAAQHVGLATGCQSCQPSCCSLHLCICLSQQSRPVFARQQVSQTATAASMPSTQQPQQQGHAATRCTGDDGGALHGPKDPLHHHCGQQRWHRHCHRPRLGHQCVLACWPCMLGCSAVRCITQYDQRLHADHLWIISDTASAGIRTVQ